MRKEWTIFAGLLTIFLLAYFLNFTDSNIQRAIMDAFYMLQWYARNHTLACVVPAMFIAGAIASFLSKEAVLRHLGPRANKAEAYSVASVSGTVLAVCSCSVLPMFAGIYRVGAGLGPAAAFLYSGPAINVMAIFLTARVLGYDLGIARIVGSVVFAVVIGVIMAAIFHRDEEKREAGLMQLPNLKPPQGGRRLIVKLIQVLGPGCPKCTKLKENVETAVQQAGVEAAVEKVTDINQMMSFGVMMTPALVIDGEVKSAGKALSPEDIKKLLK